MRRLPAVMLLCCLGVAVPLLGARQDINRDGRLDDEDVRVLGRMVAGLDPVDLDCDQNGDHAITLDDVNLLLNAIAAGTPVSPGAVGGKRPGAAAGVVFYALQRNGGGSCLVVAGEAGIQAGDTVFGAFPSFQQAQYEVVSRCGQAGPRDAAPSRPASLPKTPAPSASAAVVAVAVSSRGGETNGVYSFNLLSGEGFLFDGFGKKAFHLRKRRMRHKLFEVLGLANMPPTAAADNILVDAICEKGGKLRALLVVDTRTGKMGYLSGLDVDPTGGRPVPVSDTPAAGLAGDGGHLLIMRNNASGKTLGAYICRASTGECRLFRDLGGLPRDIRSTPTSSLPAITGPVTACVLRDGSGASSSFLLLDGSAGSIFLVAGLDRDPVKLHSRTLQPNLLRAFPEVPDRGSRRQFLPVPINDKSDATVSVLVIDTASGGMALLKDIDRPSKAKLSGLGRNLRDAPSGAAGVTAAAGRIDDAGRTKGAWLFDVSASAVSYLNSLQEPGKLGFRAITLR